MYAHRDERLDEATRERFWKNVQTGPQCWNWLGERTQTGPILVDALGAFMSPRRASYLLHGGELTGDEVLITTCGNPMCVNPAHLRPAWLKEEDDYLRAHYERETYKTIAAALGRQSSTVRMRALKLGLRKGRGRWAPQATIVSDGDCLRWTGPHKTGYAVLRQGSKECNVARREYERVHGAIPNGHVLLHTCGNRWCVNPDHLRPVRSPVRRQSHCRHGHPFDEENTYVWKGNRRRCRQCFREYCRRRQEARRAQRARPWRWTAAEDQTLRERYATDSPKALATELGRSLNAVHARAVLLGLRRLKRDARVVSGEYRHWTEHEDTVLVREYMSTNTRALAQRLDRTVEAIRQRFAVLRKKERAHD